MISLKKLRLRLRLMMKYGRLVGGLRETGENPVRARRREPKK